jgi:predicted nuclease of predicted toxin-antitoxin system
MRFLADESCDFAVVRALRKAGHDVKAVAEMSPGISDEDVAMHSADEMRILLTEDKDFGQMIYTKSQVSAGVIFLRFPANARLSMSDMIVQLVEDYGEKLHRRFVVVNPSRVRITGIPFFVIDAQAG